MQKGDMEERCLGFRIVNIGKDCEALFGLYLRYSSKTEMPVQIKSKEQFDGWISKHIQMVCHDFYVITCNNDIIGYVCSYRFRLIDRTCCISCTLRDELITFRKKALELFLNKLYELYPLRIVYMYSVQDDQVLNDHLMQLGFVQECVLKDCIYSSSHYLDKVIWKKELAH